ncbi:hypothetical protein U1Q18_008093 [Sarracenia purpurea var. burkii]
MKNIQESTFEITRLLSLTPSFLAKIDDRMERDLSPQSSSSEFHGFWRNMALEMPAALFVLYLAFHAKKNLRKLSNGRSYVMIAYYALLWFVAGTRISSRFM